MSDCVYDERVAIEIGSVRQLGFVFASCDVESSSTSGDREKTNYNMYRALCYTSDDALEGACVQDMHSG